VARLVALFRLFVLFFFGYFSWMTTTRSDTFSPDSIDQWKAHFDLHGYCILRDVLSKTVLLGAEAAAASLVDNLAERLIAQNLVKDTFKDAPFNERLSLLCATCPQMLPNLYRARPSISLVDSHVQWFHCNPCIALSATHLC